jgi:hypothetical protein
MKITLRAFIIGLAWVIVQTMITPYNTFYIQGSKLAGNHFPAGAMIVLLFMTFVVNTTLRKIKPGWQLGPGELLVVWIMVVVASGMPAMGFGQFLYPCLVAPIYFASPENDWENILHQYIPRWLIVWDKIAVDDFYEGSSFGGSVPWLAWLKPLAVWTIFALLIFFVMICLAVILRKQWMDRERFTFPLVQIPVEVVGTQGASPIAFFRNRLVLLGASIPFALHLINGLHRYFPTVPRIPTVFNVYQAFTEKPWVTLRWWPAVRIVIYPSVIAITYLLTLEVSLSLWLFFLLFKVQYIIMNALGLRISPWVSASRQVMGGALVFTVVVFWSSRAHLKDIFRKTFTRGSNVDDSQEPLPYPVALLGSVGGIMLLVMLCNIAGITVWVAIGVMAAIFVLTIVLTWMVVNGGLLLVQAPLFPSEYLEVPLGTLCIGAQSLTILSFQRAFLRDWGELLMPSIMHGFKIPDYIRLNQRKLLAVMTISIVVAIGVTHYASLSLIYSKGALSMQHWTYVQAPTGYFQRMANRIQWPSETNWPQVYSMIGGAVVTFLLLFMRRRFLWWPLHPIGYLLGATYPPYQLWFSIFFGWLIKYLVLKFGDIKRYRAMRPFFMGAVVGEYAMIGIWTILGMFTGVGYYALPG